MKITSFSYRLTREGRGFATALLAAGLQLSLARFRSAVSETGGENEARNAFTWRNLQSDIAGVADRTDPNLVNSWGLTINTTANVFWIADNGEGFHALPSQRSSRPVAEPTTPEFRDHSTDLC